jgi:mRNA interferase MazF
MPNAKRGEVWLVDLGLAGKVRPALIVNTPFTDEERALYCIVPHTTAVRGGRFEVDVPMPFLKVGAFDVQNLGPLAAVRLIRRLGVMNEKQFEQITAAIRVWMELR